MVQPVTRAQYAANMRFQDPVANYSSLDGFIFNVQALRTAFKVQFDLHDIKVNGPEEIRTRWAVCDDCSVAFSMHLSVHSSTG